MFTVGREAEGGAAGVAAERDAAVGVDAPRGDLSLPAAFGPPLLAAILPWWLAYDGTAIDGAGMAAVE